MIGLDIFKEDSIISSVAIELSRREFVSVATDIGTSLEVVETIAGPGDKIVEYGEVYDVISEETFDIM